MTDALRSDVLVLGGGAAGLAFAIALRRATLPKPPHNRGTVTRPLSITVVESGPEPTRPAPGAVGMRVLALSPASRQFLADCGAALAPDFACPYQRMVVWQRDRALPGSCLHFDAAELGVPELGAIADLAVVRALLWDEARANDIRILTGARPAALLRAADALSITLESGEQLSARLVVGADGANSWLRKALKIDTSGRDYGQRALVAHLRSSKPHAATAWQRFLPSGPLALLPLPDGRSSLVWSAHSALAEELLALDDAEFSARLTQATQGVLGTLTVDTPRAAFPLRAAHATSYTTPRAALIGDAAHQIHPLAGLGANLGFADAAALAGVLAPALMDPDFDPGDLRVLRRYERSRRGDNAATLNLMTALHTVFAGDDLTLLRTVAGAGLGWVDQWGLVKNGLARLAMRA
jgi:2-octaprenylphenol hydroxylase